MVIPPQNYGLLKNITYFDGLPWEDTHLCCN